MRNYTKCCAALSADSTGSVASGQCSTTLAFDIVFNVLPDDDFCRVETSRGD